MKKLTILIAVICLSLSIFSQETEYKTINDIQYYPKSVNKSDEYINERCVLDIYYPVNMKNFSTIIWFHGGGLTSGSKQIPDALKGKKHCIIAVNYRLYPKIKAPKYIKDAAAAVAWVFNNIESYGGDSTKIFVSGHSAGGYLTLMLGLDKQWLAKYDIDANRIAGLIPFSGHTITHLTVREERGIDKKQPIVDELAPLYHVRADAPPLILITGDRRYEMLGRYEENAYMMRMMKVVGHEDTELLELQGYGHGMTYPAFPLLLQYMKKTIEQR